MANSALYAAIFCRGKAGAKKLCGHSALAAPFLAYVLLCLWIRLGLDPYTSPGTESVSCPMWWQQAGLGLMQWMDMGFIPAALCGLCGLVAIGRGIYARSPLCLMEGAAACLASPVLCFVYMALTF